MEEKLSQLQNIDWEFSDYKGFSSFPADINSLHWHPAPFVPQIPAILIQALTEEGDTILDPFAGAGVTLVEAARLKRRFIGIDINPNAVNIIKAKFYALSLLNKQLFLTIKKDLESLPSVDSIEDYCMKFGVDKEVIKWFEKKTLKELFSLHQYVKSEPNSRNRLLKKVLFSSILQKCCSQREHYTYVTDGCYPDKLLYINAKELFLNQMESTRKAVETFRKQYRLMYHKDWSFSDSVISVGDARDLRFLKNGSVDIVVTSPPYLGVNDYVRSMRLTWLFFPEKGIQNAMKYEIGARWKRNRKYAYEEYVDGMDKSFSEISRALKPTGFLCLVIGKGRGRVCKRDVVEELLEILCNKYEFRSCMRISRKIKFRRIQVPGVENEEIIILNKNGAK